MTEPLQTAAVPERPRRRVLRNTVFSLVTKAQGAILGYLTTLILLHALSVEGYGLYSVLFMGVVANLSLLTRFGIGNVLYRFIPEYFSQANFRVIARLFYAANLVQTGAALVLSAIALLLAPQIAVWIRYPGSENVLRVFVLGSFAYLLCDNYRILFNGLFQQQLIMRVNIAYSLLRLGALWWVARMPDPLFKIVLIEGVMFVLLLIFYYIAYRAYIVARIRTDSEPHFKMPWRRFARYSGLYYLNEIGLMLINQASDLFLVSGLAGEVAAGLYALANRILQIATQLQPNKVFGDVIEPLFFSEYGSSRPEESRFGFNLFLKVNLFTSLPMGIWISLAGQPLITQLFDARYADAAIILAVSGFILPMIALRTPVGLVLQNAERPDLLLIAKSMGVVKILLGIWLVGQYGVLAMVWITFATTLAELAMNFWFVAGVLHVRPDWAGLLRMTVNNLITAVLFYPLLPLFQSRVGVILSIPAFALIYLVVNILHKPFTPEERTLFNQKLPYPMWKF